MRIECTTMAEFLDTLAGLVERGIMFRAYSYRLTIECTGGY